MSGSGRWFESNRLRHRPGSARTMSERIGVPDMEMTMLAENCTVGGNRLSVMVLHR